jgi:PAS domain S-box-containing protein
MLSASTIRWRPTRTLFALLLLVPLIASWWLFMPHDSAVVPAAVLTATGVVFLGVHARTYARLRRALEERQVFATLVDNSADFIGIADPAGNPMYLNPAGRQMVGLARDVPIAATRILDYYPPEERKHAEDVILKAMVERGLWQGKTRFRNWKTEESIPVSDTHFMIRDRETGQTLGMATITRDISELERLEHELRLSEARASGILSISADAIISIDERQRITSFNEGAERIFDYAQAEALGAPLEMLIPERFHEVHRRHVERFAVGSRVARRMGEATTPIFGLRKNGEEFPADASISKLEIAGKRVLTVSLRDISESKRIETEHAFLSEVGVILSSTLDYEQTLANIAELAVRDLADFCIVDTVGEAGEVRKLKVAAHDPSRAWVSGVLENVQIAPDRRYFTEAAVKTLRTVVIEDYSPQRTDELAQNDEHLAALRALDTRSAIIVPLVARGEPVGAIAFISSSHARAYGGADVPLLEELARRAALSIDNARLYRAAQRAIQSRDDVLAIVAHDLRNPLNAIRLQAEMLAASAVDGQRERIAGIERSAARMKRLVEDLLDVARMEAGGLRLDRAAVPVRELVADAVRAHEAIATSASIELLLEAAPEGSEIWADRDRVLQILENLIGNALKFTPSGGCITVGAALRPGVVQFWVADTGAGIEPEHQAHVFDRFWQARGAERHGAGLGLPIVKGLVEAHGGQIWLESTPGRGSTFWFTIPAQR